MSGIAAGWCTVRELRGLSYGILRRCDNNMQMIPLVSRVD